MFQKKGMVLTMSLDFEIEKVSYSAYIYYLYNQDFPLDFLGGGYIWPKSLKNASKCRKWLKKGKKEGGTSHLSEKP